MTAADRTNRRRPAERITPGLMAPVVIAMLAIVAFGCGFYASEPSNTAVESGTANSRSVGQADNTDSSTGSTADADGTATTEPPTTEPPTTESSTTTEQPTTEAPITTEQPTTEAPTTAVPATETTTTKPSASSSTGDTESQSAGSVLEPGHYGGFTSPTGNIACYMRTGLAVSCWIGEKQWEIEQPTHDADCALYDWGNAIDLLPTGVQWPCYSDMGWPINADPLPYGDRMKVGEFECLSAENGVTCTNGSGEGFRLARAKVTIF